MARSTRLLLALFGAATLGNVAPPAVNPAWADTIVMPGPGTPIQDAINAARPGQTIRVAPGVYPEDLWIHTDGIRLLGSGPARTRLVAPTNPPFFCSTTAADVNGICVANPPDPNGNPSQIVRGVRVSGFAVDSFPGFGVVGFGTAGLRIDNNDVISSGAGGIGSFVSTGTRVLANNTHGSVLSVGNGPDEAGIVIGDSPDAQAVVTGNHSFANHFGITLRDASVGIVAGNVVDANCDGILVMASSFGSGVAAHWVVTSNQANGNNASCVDLSSPAPIQASGTGIAVVGASQTVVNSNRILDNRPSGPADWAAGIAVVASPGAPTGGASLRPANDTVAANTIVGNQPDLLWDLTGHNVNFAGNHCYSSTPTGLCSLS